MSNLLKKYRIIIYITILLSAILIYFICRSEGKTVEREREKVGILHPGDTIGVLAPASNGGMTDYNPSIRLLESMGYKVKLAPSVTNDFGFLAGDDEERAKDINDFFKDDDIKAILCLRGGYGSARILNKLDYDMIRRHPKMLIGYSDITALHAAIGEKSGIVTIHGPMMSSFKTWDFTPFTLYNFENGISGSLPKGSIRMPAGKTLRTIQEGDAEGILEGGNLAVIASLAGTPYELKGNGAILVLEDTGEDPYRIDRMMQQLYQNGLLKRVAAIAYGDFYSSTPKEGEFTVEDVLSYYGKLSGKPVIAGLPIGHGPDNLFLPLGVKASIHAGKDGSASLVLEEDYKK